SGDGCLQRLDILLGRRLLEQRDDEMARVGLCLLREWIVRNDLLPLIGAADEKVDAQVQAARRLFLEAALQLIARARSAAEDRVAALQQRSSVAKAQIGEELAHIRHRYLVQA